MQPCHLVFDGEDHIAHSSHSSPSPIILDEDFKFRSEATNVVFDAFKKNPWEAAALLELFPNAETDNDDISTRSSSPCPSLTTSTCADSDFSGDEGPKSSSNPKGGQDEAACPQYSYSPCSARDSTEGKVGSGKETSRDGCGRDGDSPGTVIGLDLRFKQVDEGIRFACPYRKRNPVACNVRNYSQCALSFSNLARVREHLEKCHLIGKDGAANADSATSRHPVHTFGTGLWMTSETFDSIKVQEGGDSNPRQKWEYIWRCLFGNTDHVQEPDFEAPIEAEELLFELQNSLHEFDAQVRQEVQGWAPILPSSSSALASLGARITELWVIYLNSTFERCERKVRGSSSQRLVLPRRAMTDLVSHRPTQSGFVAPSPGLTSRAKTIDCIRTTPPSLDSLYPDVESILSYLPQRVVSGEFHVQLEGSSTPIMSGSSTILGANIDEEPVRGNSSSGVDRSREPQEVDDSDMSDTSSEGDKKPEDGEEAEEDIIDEIIRKVSSLILSAWTSSPPNVLIQAVQTAVENFVIELFDDVLPADCPHEGESSPGSNSKSDNTSDSSSKPSSHSHSPGKGPAGSGQGENPKGDGSEQGDRRPGPDNVVSHDGCPSKLCCPFRIRNPMRFNSQDFPICATRQWEKLSSLKRHIKAVHLLKDEMKHKCQKCKQGFATIQILEQHVVDTMENPCKFVSQSELDKNGTNNPEDGLSEEGLKRLDNRKQQGKVQSWQSLWRLCFPDDKRIPPCTLPDEIEGITQSFQKQQTSLNQKIGAAIKQHVPEVVSDGVVTNLATQLSTLFQNHVTDTLRDHRFVFGRAASRDASPEQKSQSTPAASSRQAYAEPANKKRKSRHAETQVAPEPQSQVHTPMRFQQALDSGPEPDLTEWTMLAQPLSESTMTSPESHYSMNPPDFQGGSGFAPMDMMLNSQQYQTVPPTPPNSYGMVQPFHPRQNGQGIMGGMGRPLATPSAMGMNFCSNCGGRWPCAAGCVRT